MTLPLRSSALFTVGITLILSGCSGQTDSEFGSYSSLEENPNPTAVVTPRDDASSDDANSAVEKPDSPDGSGNLLAQAAPGNGSENGDPETSTETIPQDAATDSGDPTQQTDVATDTGNTTSETNVEPPAPREVKLLVTERDFETEGPDGALRVSYDDLDLLKVLNMEPVTTDAPDLLPDWLKSLDGKRVRVRGFMYPTFEERGLTRFILARDNQICCFGRDAKVYDLVRVGMKKDETTDYIQGRPFDVVGVFRITPEVFGDELDRLYAIEDAVVIEH